MVELNFTAMDVVRSELSGGEVFVGLLDHGLFAEKMPPCFISEGLADAASAILAGVIHLDDSALKDRLKKANHDYIRYEVLRDINVPRHMGIPHPEGYAMHALSIMKCWDEVNTHCNKPDPKVSRIHVRNTGGGRIFEMNYKGSDRFQLEEDEIGWMAGAQFLVKADISACFPSIYTHSIPWAMHTRAAAKVNRGFGLVGNLIDTATQLLRDQQTNGLLIGPHSSNIISEIILTHVDCVLIEKGYKKLTRHIDDYHFYAVSHSEAERFIRDLGLALREFELSLNEKKTRILPLPMPKEENWVRELNRFSFPKGEPVKYGHVRGLLDLALDLGKAAGTSAPINYAIKMIPDSLNDRAKRLYTQEAINLALAYPYLAPLLGRYVFDRFAHPAIQGQIQALTTELIKLGVKKLYPDAVSHGLYYSLRYAVVPEITQEDYERMLQLDDCLLTVLLLEYAKTNSEAALSGIIMAKSQQLKSEERRDVDRQWLLAYQTWDEADLRGNGQVFLADLKQRGFKFVDENWGVARQPAVSFPYSNAISQTIQP